MCSETITTKHNSTSKNSGIIIHVNIDAMIRAADHRHGDVDMHSQYLITSCVTVAKLPHSIMDHHVTLILLFKNPLLWEDHPRCIQPVGLSDTLLWKDHPWCNQSVGLSDNLYCERTVPDPDVFNLIVCQTPSIVRTVLDVFNLFVFQTPFVVRGPS